MDLARKLWRLLGLKLWRNCFKPCCNGFSSEANYDLMKFVYESQGFKPCCNGFSSEAGGKCKRWSGQSSFKPCCNGFSSEAIVTPFTTQPNFSVSNLVVMDLARKLIIGGEENIKLLWVSNLVVMDLARKRPVFREQRLFPKSFKPCCNGFSSEAL